MENQQSNQGQEIVRTEANPTEIKKSQKKFLLKFIFIFTGISFLIAFLIGGFVLGSYQSKKVSELIPTLTISPSPAAANWKTYATNLFSFKYPSNFVLTEFLAGFVVINHNVVFFKELSATSSATCRGDCPVIENIEDTVLGNYQAKKYTGYVGSIGGNIPQSYLKYEIKDPSSQKFFSIILYELPIWDDSKKMADYLPDRKIGKILQDDQRTFNQILSTFKFLPASPTGGDQNQGVVCTQEAKQCPDGSYVSRDSSNNCEFKECPK